MDLNLASFAGTLGWNTAMQVVLFASLFNACTAVTFASFPTRIFTLFLISAFLHSVGLDSRKHLRFSDDQLDDTYEISAFQQVQQNCRDNTHYCRISQYCRTVIIFLPKLIIKQNYSVILCVYSLPEMITCARVVKNSELWRKTHRYQAHATQKRTWVDPRKACWANRNLQKSSVKHRKRQESADSSASLQAMWCVGWNSRLLPDRKAVCRRRRLGWANWKNARSTTGSGTKARQNVLWTLALAISWQKHNDYDLLSFDFSRHRW